jgi:hypothetical protein
VIDIIHVLNHGVILTVTGAFESLEITNLYFVFALLSQLCFFRTLAQKASVFWTRLHIKVNLWGFS